MVGDVAGLGRTGDRLFRLGGRGGRLLAVPRPGRVAIRTGGFDIPFAFKVRRGERVLFFVREEDPERGGWSDVYTVLDRPKGTDGFEPCYYLPPAIPSGWSLRGRVPVDDLRFEHHERSTYVTRGSLERSLSAAGMSESRRGDREPAGAGRGRRRDPPWDASRLSRAGRRSVRTVLAAAGLIPATLLLFGLGASGTPPLAAIESAEQGPQQEERPLTRSYHGAAVVNGKIYVIGGAGEDNKPFGSVQVYDPATGTWAARANMPTARGLFGTSAVGGTIYAIGGTTRGRDKLAVVEAYDTATDTWTRRADMPTPRNALSAAVVDGKIYAIGGWGYDRPEGGWESIDPTATGQDFSTVEVYDPETDTWATRADMPTPRSHMTVSALGGKIYAIGGGARIVAGRSGEYRPLLEVYDTATNRWARAADLPTPRSVLSSSVVDGRIYVMGGAFQPRTDFVDRRAACAPCAPCPSWRSMIPRAADGRGAPILPPHGVGSRRAS